MLYSRLLSGWDVLTSGDEGQWSFSDYRFLILMERNYGMTGTVSEGVRGCELL